MISKNKTKNPLQSLVKPSAQSEKDKKPRAAYGKNIVVTWAYPRTHVLSNDIKFFRT